MRHAKIALSALVLALCGAAQSAEQVIPEPSAENFAKTRGVIKASPGETPWYEIDWLTRVQEAREKAAAEGKPLVIYIGGNNGSVNGTC